MVMAKFTLSEKELKDLGLNAEVGKSYEADVWEAKLGDQFDEIKRREMEEQRKFFATQDTAALGRHRMGDIEKIKLGDDPSSISNDKLKTALTAANTLNEQIKREKAQVQTSTETSANTPKPKPSKEDKTPEELRLEELEAQYRKEEDKLKEDHKRTFAERHKGFGKINTQAYYQLQNDFLWLLALIFMPKVSSYKKPTADETLLKEKFDALNEHRKSMNLPPVVHALNEKGELVLKPVEEKGLELKPASLDNATDPLLSKVTAEVGDANDLNADSLNPKRTPV
jgi:hypothetical protein